jgi:hypothetical protein
MTRPRVERRYGALVLVLEEAEYVVRKDAAKALLDDDQPVDVRVLGGPQEPVGRAYPDRAGRIVFQLPGQALEFGVDHLRALEILPAGAAVRAIAGVEA